MTVLNILRDAYVLRVHNPPGWQGVCAAHASDHRYKVGAWAFCVSRAWKVSRGRW